MIFFLHVQLLDNCVICVFIISGALLRHDPYHHPPREFQSDPQFQGDRFDEPRGHSPRPPREGDPSMYHHQQHREDNFRRPYDGFHHHHPEVDERVRNEIPPVGAGMVGQFFRPEVKTIQAEKIFDPPGRRDRPSHVSTCMIRHAMLVQ